MKSLAMRLVHRRSFLLSCTFFARRQANRLVRRRSFLLSRAFSAMKSLAIVGGAVSLVPACWVCLAGFPRVKID